MSKIIAMKISSNNQITLPKKIRKYLNVKSGDTVTLNLSTSKLSKMPTINDWKKVINSVPRENIFFNKDGFLNKRKTSKSFQKWLKKG